ncbi:MAG: glucosyltransferase domain-containing protein [Clostridia bacterium]|nr:glucosyltransferase domain-containing protein [Clostridia bacterium]
MQTGRFVQPIIRFLLGDTLVIPWLDGSIGLTALGFAVFLTLKTFGFKKHVTALAVAGIYVTNMTVSVCIASCMHDFVDNCIGYLLAVIVFYWWVQLQKKFSLLKFFVSVLFSAIVLGIYQGILPVSVILIMIFSVDKIINGQKLKKHFYISESARQSFCLADYYIFFY